MRGVRARKERAGRNGGDATAAIFLAHFLTDGPRSALAKTADAMFGVVQATQDAGHRELQLIRGQDAIANAGRRFEVTEL